MANTIRIKRGTKAQIEASELSHGEPAISTDYDQVYVGTAASKVRLASASEIPAFATPSITLGTSAAAGDATTVIRSNATIAAFDATAPSTQAFGDSPSAGSASVAARRDHKHGMPSLNDDQIRKITVSTDSPSGGSNGDLWFKYTA